jgi:homocysteine S-methyltransferase
VDLFILETFSSLRQLRLALAAVKRVSALPVICTMTFTDGTGTAMGESVAAVVEALEQDGADVIGANCGTGPASILAVVREMAGLTDKPICAQPNAGYPMLVEGRTLFQSGADYFARYAGLLVEAGASVVGGCCGTTPEHIRLTAAALSGMRVASRPPRAARVRSAGCPAESLIRDSIASRRRVVVVELAPPKTNDPSRIISAAVMLKAKGAQVFSFPDNPLAQVRMNSIMVAGLVAQKTGLECIFHYTCRDRNSIGMQSDILGAHALGLHAVLAVTGDPVSPGTTVGARPVFDLNSVKLVQLIQSMNKTFGMSMLTGVGFNPNFEDCGPQLARLKMKKDAGAAFAMSQPLFDAGKIIEISARAREIGIPLFVGILPLVSRRNAEFLHNEVPGMQVPEEIRKRMDIPDKQQAQEEGIRIAREIIAAVKDAVDGFYLISPMGRYEVSAALLEAASGEGTSP